MEASTNELESNYAVIVGKKQKTQVRLLLERWAAWLKSEGGPARIDEAALLDAPLFISKPPRGVYMSCEVSAVSQALAQACEVGRHKEVTVIFSWYLRKSDEAQRNVWEKMHLSETQFWKLKREAEAFIEGYIMATRRDIWL